MKKKAGRRAMREEQRQTKKDLGSRTEKAREDGFNAHDIKWNPERTNFKFHAEGIDFYGWWRRIDKTLVAIDIFAKRQVGDNVHEFTVDGIPYQGDDPRGNSQSLNADIAAACTRWYHTKIHSSAKAIDDVIRAAKKPTVHIDQVSTLDNIILKLREYRDTAIRCGGVRYFEIIGDRPGPILTLQIDLTRQALILEGKPPSMHTGIIADRASANKGKRSKDEPERRITTSTPDDANLDSWLEKLAEAKKKGDDQAQRKIRAMLRKMGHKGGARAMEPPKEKEKEVKKKGKRAVK